MRYVERDQAGKVIGHYACEQAYARELVADDHPDLVAWESAREEAQLVASEASPSKTIPRLQEKVVNLETRIADLEELIKARRV